VVGGLGETTDLSGFGRSSVYTFMPQTVILASVLCEIFLYLVLSPRLSTATPWSMLQTVDSDVFEIHNSTFNNRPSG
jgi:hypothetical protein